VYPILEPRNSESPNGLVPYLYDSTPGRVCQAKEMARQSAGRTS